jgi:Vitamin K-dependent gamma-carboxylase/Lipase maturation factor
VLLVSLQARNPMLLTGGDHLLRCQMFWSLFLPLGARWSLDSRGRPPAPDRVCSFATAALLVQIVVMYVFTALLKDDPVWTREFTAIYYALQGDHLTSRWGYEVLPYPGLLRVLTIGTLVLELVGPLVLFYPARSWGLRTFIVAAFWGLHLGIAVTMNIGLFSYVCMVCWVAFLPSGFWDALARCSSGDPRPDQPGWAAPSLVTRGLIAVLLCYVVLLNVTRLYKGFDSHLSAGPLRIVGDSAQLNQNWCMFAPRPTTAGGWFNLRGTLADGTNVNLLHPDDPPQETRPAMVSDEYASTAWRISLIHLLAFEPGTHVRSVGEYLCRRWNATHPADRQLVTAQIIAMVQPIPPPGEPAKPVNERLLWQWDAPAR